MYIPPYYAEADAGIIKSLIQANGFATLVVNNRPAPIAVHIPLMLHEMDTGTWVLHGHVARANPIWQKFGSEQEVLCMFMGAHAYVSSSWYGSEGVPTWDYQAVHLYGTTTILSGTALDGALSKLMSHYETKHANAPMAYQDLSPAYVSRLKMGIVAFEILVTRVEAKSKLSQDKNETDRKNVISHLSDSTAYNSQVIAAKIKERLP
jgi:transcriptional regulator